MMELDRLYTITLVSINMCGKFIKLYISSNASETCFVSEYEISPWFMLKLDRLTQLHVFWSIRVVSISVSMYIKLVSLRNM